MSEPAGAPEPSAPSQPAWQPVAAGNADATMPIKPPKKGLPAWLWALLGCSGCGCLMIPIMAAILFPVFAKAREKARDAGCQMNERQIYVSIQMYSQDFDDTLPPAKKWMDVTYPYTKSEAVYRCPAEKEKPYGYAFNSALSGKVTTKIEHPDEEALIYDSNANVKNATDAVKSLPNPGRHNGKNNIVDASGDGHHSDPAQTP